MAPPSVLLPFQLTSVAQLAETARLCDAAGVGRLWLVESFGIDSWVAVAAVAGAHPGLKFGTAVSLMPWRHPLETATRLRAMAEVLPGRFTAGFGTSEPNVVGDVLGGVHPASPTTYAREYLNVLRLCLTGPPTRVDGRYFGLWTNDLRDPGRPHGDHPELLLGALGPGMARVGAEAAAGVVTWLLPPAALARDIVPAVHERGGRVVTLVPCLPLASRAAVRWAVERLVGIHVAKPHYRRMLRRALGDAPADHDALIDLVVDRVVAWGPPAAIRERLAAYADAGADEIGAAAYGGSGLAPGTFRRTLEVVAA